MRLVGEQVGWRPGGWDVRRCVHGRVAEYGIEVWYVCDRRESVFRCSYDCGLVEVDIEWFSELLQHFKMLF